MASVVLRTARSFPEPDDLDDIRLHYADDNVKANEFLHRRVDLEDAVAAHLAASERAPDLGFATYVISATTPFSRSDTVRLASDARELVGELFPDQEAEYERRNWKLFPTIDRVYDNSRAREELGWRPRYDFRFVLDRLKSGEPLQSSLARLVGSKRYHHATTGVDTIR
jgi:nucleoside-diphosphate-sugar epimerase